MSQSGFTEGKDVVVEYHWLDGHYEDRAAILDDAVRRRVAVIATPANTPGSLAAKAATSIIPVVFASARIRWHLGWSQAWRGPAAT